VGKKVGGTHALKAAEEGSCEGATDGAADDRGRLEGALEREAALLLELELELEPALGLPVLLGCVGLGRPLNGIIDGEPPV
jgi:hypothetical protein